MLGSLVRLRRLDICNCKSLEEILSTQGSREGETMDKILFPMLDSLVLTFLPELKRFCTGSSIECPKLKVLQIESCDQLHNFLSSPASIDVETTYESQQANSALFDEKVTCFSFLSLQLLFPYLSSNKVCVLGFISYLRAHGNFEHEQVESYMAWRNPKSGLSVHK